MENTQEESNNKTLTILKKKPSRTCSICGHHCHGKFYNVYSCESCKQFFRRIVLKQCFYTCKKEPECSEGRARNMKCRGCRLEKCLLVGMDPSYMIQKMTMDQRIFVSELVRHAQFLKRQIGCMKIGYKEFDEFSCLDELLQIEARLDRIYHSPTELPYQFIAYGTLEGVAKHSKNVLTYAKHFELDDSVLCNPEILVEHAVSFGLWNKHAASFLSKTLLLLANVAKSLPAYSKLEIGDQIALIRDTPLMAKHLIMNYYSMKLRTGTVVGIRGLAFLRIFEAVAQRRYNSDKILLNAAQKIFLHGVQKITTILPSREEFILLLALVITNSAAISGLSKHGQQILQEESERYSKTLLNFQQRQYGEQAGAVRYMETVQLLSMVANNAESNRQMLEYLDNVLEQGRMMIESPKILRTFLFAN